jgi:hypothetical protein
MKDGQITITRTGPPLCAVQPTVSINDLTAADVGRVIRCTDEELGTSQNVVLVNWNATTNRLFVAWPDRPHPEVASLDPELCRFTGRRATFDSSKPIWYLAPDNQYPSTRDFEGGVKDLLGLVTGRAVEDLRLSLSSVPSTHSHPFRHAGRHEAFREVQVWLEELLFGPSKDEGR